MTKKKTTNSTDSTNKYYEVKVYDKDGKLKEIIPPSKVKELSWKNFKRQTNWRRQASKEYKTFKAMKEMEDNNNA